MDDRDWSRWLVQAHHPDWMRVPEPSPGRIREDRARAALTWNAFRTLALIQPSFWLRQLHARMFGFDERYKAPASLDVRFWQPAVPVRAAEPRSGVVDVVLESPDAVWGFLTVFGRDVIVTRHDTHGPDPLRRTVDAVAAIAGGRRSFVGLIASSERTAPIGTGLVRGHAADLCQGRLSAGREGHLVLGIGLGTWATLATVIASAADAGAIDRPERLALRRCLCWLAAAGIRPDDPSRARGGQWLHGGVTSLLRA